MLDTTTNSATYRGGIGQSVFPIPFPFLETSHIRARVKTVDGAGRALAAGIDFSVNRVSDANGELILLGDDLPSGAVLTITRLVPLTQEILFHNQGPNSPRAMEEAVDKLTMIAQQLQNGIENVSPSGQSPGDASGSTDTPPGGGEGGSGDDGGPTGDLAELIARLETLEGGIAGLAGRLNSLGALSRAEDAPANDKPHMRKNGDWVEYDEGSGSGGDGGSGGDNPPGGNPIGGGAIVGEIRFLPFRASELPAGWHFCNGGKYDLSSPQGNALASLPPTMKTDWGIVAEGGMISLPNLFSGTDGYFPRAVDSASRQPGSKQADAIRNIAGSFSLSAVAGVAWLNSSTGKSEFTGPFKGVQANKSYSFGVTTHGYNATGDLAFDASACVPTANENRPMNIGMTPAMYLGV